MFSFILTRYLFPSWVHWMGASDSMQLSIFANDAARDGVLSIARIRMSPFPYSMINGVLASTSLASPLAEKSSMLEGQPRISIVKFGLATVLTTPRLAAYTFAASRLATMAKGLDIMDGKGKAIEIAYVIGSIAFTTATSYHAHHTAKARVTGVANVDGDVILADVWKGVSSEDIQGSALDVRN
jgi:hypothetical protein